MLGRFGAIGFRGGLMMLVMLAGAAGFCLLIWLILRAQNGNRRMPEREYGGRLDARRDEAMDLLRHRLAKGEITTEEYDSIRAKLQDDGGR